MFSRAVRDCIVCGIRLVEIPSDARRASLPGDGHEAHHRIGIPD